MSDLLARLLAAGTPPELVGEVARELAMAAARQEVAQEAIEARRTKDRERQERRRSREVTECHVTERDNATEPAPSLSPQTPQTHPHPSNNNPPRAKGHRLPSDWQPSDLPADLATAVSFWPAKALERELARFRDWAASATGPNAIKLDWQAAWRNWVRKAEDEGRYGRNVGKPPGNAGGSGGNDLVSNILGKQAAPA